MFPVGYPAIGVSGSNIVIAFQAFMPETSQAGFNYADVFITSSSNGGLTWATPSNVSNTLTLDERYVSMSKWNPALQANLVYQEDPEPGAGAFGTDLAPVSRNRQRFVRIGPFASVGEPGGIPAEFTLFQNYPNPFNPTTKIEFRIPARPAGGANFGLVTLKVFDLLGREVATLVNEVMQPGSYERVFHAEGLASGVYLCQLKSGSFVQTKKLLLLR
ncbi:MAG: T9SS type A sorting domain-containing protein [Bacteroidetes bacterium]|nr:T9SS type A sorting domain-containing protein [Bacteroidota bacterium]MCW5897157.1 T9SS type A sorting domain-containing protein [Bacteroidota bacterium]